MKYLDAMKQEFFLNTYVETFTWADLLEVKLPIPPVKEQEYIVDIFRVLQERTLILKNMKTQIKNLCPILIKGSIEEASKSKEV